MRSFNFSIRLDERWLRYGLLAIVGVATLIVAAESFLAAIALVVVAAIALLFVFYPKQALFAALISRPMIDATWNYTIPILGLNLLQITGVAFPVLALLILGLRRQSLFSFGLGVWFSLWLMSNLLSFSIGVFDVMENSFSRSFQAVISRSPILFQLLNGIAAYFIIPHLFNNEKDRRRFIVALIVAGLFPLITGLMQIAGLITGGTLRTTGDLSRITGLYYDSTNMRMYSMHTLVALFAYYHTFVKQFDIRKHFWMPLMSLALLIIIYRGYSKAALGILIIWGVLFMIFRPGLRTTLSFALVLVGLLAVSDTVEDSTRKLLRKEIAYSEGDLPDEYQYTLLGGRIQRWQNVWNRFENADEVRQLVGVQFTLGITAHNDFLRVLVTNGYIGLCLYVLLLMAIGLKALSSDLIYRDGISFAAVMVFVAFIVDSMGLVPSLYPGYCWTAFGILGVAFNREQPSK